MYSCLEKKRKTSLPPLGCWGNARHSGDVAETQTQPHSKQRLLLICQSSKISQELMRGKKMGPSCFGLSRSVWLLLVRKCPGERPGREQAFSNELKVHIKGAGKGCPGKSLSERKTWNRVERGNGSRGEAGREGGVHRCPAAQAPVPGDRSSVAGAGAGAAAAAQPPASAVGHRGSQMCTRSAGRKTTFSCRSYLSHQLIPAQGSPRQTEQLFL